MKLLRQGANRATLNHNWIDRTRIQPGHGQRIRKSDVMEEIDVCSSLNSGHLTIHLRSPKSAKSELMRCSKLRLVVDHVVCAASRAAGRSRPSILAVLS